MGKDVATATKIVAEEEKPEVITDPTPDAQPTTAPATAPTQNPDETTIAAPAEPEAVTARTGLITAERTRVAAMFVSLQRWAAKARPDLHLFLAKEDHLLSEQERDFYLGAIMTCDLIEQRARMIESVVTGKSPVPVGADIEL